jgi:hypothetical protein
MHRGGGARDGKHKSCSIASRETARPSSGPAAAVQIFITAITQ